MIHSRFRTVSWRTLSVLGMVSLAAVLSAAPAARQNHWAFQPVAPVKPPEVRGVSWVQTPIDRFILSKLEAAGIKPAQPATQEQLIRRLSLGLTGLPPTPEEIELFARDPSPGSDERLIDRLLASPHYGERWARHWLDLARYAETDGFEHDAVRPHSWRYRDYVIAAFNEDKPYDRFVREQLAGDELWPDNPPALIATGFNLLGPDMVDSADQIQRRLNTLNDMTDTAASVFLGLTFGCARCHDHKFEPFTQRDYFSMQAFFAPGEFHREQPVPTAVERAAHDAAMAEYNSRTRPQREQIEAIEAPYRQRLFDEKLSKLSEDVQLAHRTPKERRTMEQEGSVQETLPQVQITDAEVTKALSREDKARRAGLEAELKKIPKPPPLPLAMMLQNTNGHPPRTCVLARGDYNNPREEVAPGFPAVLCRNSEGETPIQHGVPATDSQGPLSLLTSAATGAARSGSRTRSSPGNEAQTPGRTGQSLLTPAATKRRTALANWIASAENPLTARVVVNRLWQHHFGRGLVSTPSDFGTRGQPPTHPELLDWLATEFVRAGWSVKRMQKLILLSAAYQQSSTATTEALARDPENRLFSRQNRVRLEGEIVRDSLLAISGRLDREIGGPSVSPPIPADIAKTAKNWTASPDPKDHNRRSIYVFARRNLRFPFLEVFDAPDNNLSCPERGRSTTAPQSLTLLNSMEVMAAAQATAEQVTKKAEPDDQRIETAFRLILGRRPAGNELTMAREFLKASSSRREEADSLSSQEATSAAGLSLLTSAATKSAWTELCRALFNLNAFVYVE